MKDTDKVTMTVGQLKKLVKESRLIESDEDFGLSDEAKDRSSSYDSVLDFLLQFPIESDISHTEYYIGNPFKKALDDAMSSWEGYFKEFYEKYFDEPMVKDADKVIKAIKEEFGIRGIRRAWEKELRDQYDWEGLDDNGNVKPGRKHPLDD